MANRRVRKKQRTGRNATAAASSTKQPGPHKRLMENLPLEMYWMMFEDLPVNELVALYYTSKFLRRIVSGNNGAMNTAWKKGRAQKQIMGNLPDCPPFMSEADYTILLFYPQCSFCRNRQRDTVLWELQVRCCDDCFHAQLCDAGELFDMVKRDVQRRVRVEACVPSVRMTDGKQYRLRSALKKEIAHLQELGWQSRECSTYVVNQHMFLRTTYYDHIHNLKKWWTNRFYNASIDYYTAYSGTQLDLMDAHLILQLLTEPELEDQVHAIYETVNFRSRYILTHSDWMEIEPHFLKRYRMMRDGYFDPTYLAVVARSRQKVAAYIDKKRQESPECFWPTPADACFRLPIFEDCFRFSPRELPRIQRRVNNKLVQLDNSYGEKEVVRDWLATVMDECVLASGIELNSDDDLAEEDFWLASTFFRCRSPDCHSRLLSFRDLLTHECMYATPPKSSFSLWYGPTREQHLDIYETYGTCAWGEFCDELPVLDKLSHLVARQIVRTTARVVRYLNVETTSMDEMEEIAPLLVCNKCGGNEKYVWKEAIEHSRGHIKVDNTCSMTLISYFSPESRSRRNAPRGMIHCDLDLNLL